MKLAERSSDAAPIGGLMEREFVEIAGRVRSMSIGHESGVHELRCVIADNTGSITLVFQGRTNVPGIERGTRLMVKGTVTSLRREAVILNPQYEIVAAPRSATSNRTFAPHLDRVRVEPPAVKDVARVLPCLALGRSRTRGDSVSRRERPERW